MGGWFEVFSTRVYIRLGAVVPRSVLGALRGAKFRHWCGLRPVPSDEAALGPSVAPSNADAVPAARRDARRDREIALAADSLPTEYTRCGTPILQSGGVLILKTGNVSTIIRG